MTAFEIERDIQPPQRVFVAGSDAAELRRSVREAPAAIASRQRAAEAKRTGRRRVLTVDVREAK